MALAWVVAGATTGWAQGGTGCLSMRRPLQGSSRALVMGLGRAGHLCSGEIPGVADLLKVLAAIAGSAAEHPRWVSGLRDRLGAKWG